MTALGSILAFILGNKTILTIAGAVLAGMGWGFHQRLAGAKAERQKQAAQEAAAIDAANEIQEDIGALPPEVARRNLEKWSRG